MAPKPNDETHAPSEIPSHEQTVDLSTPSSSRSGDTTPTHIAEAIAPKEPGSSATSNGMAATVAPTDSQGTTDFVAGSNPPTPPKKRTEAAIPKKIGDYLVLRELGRGAMGVVYLAQHQKLHRKVALKMVLQGDFASNSERDRFIREAQSVASLQHPNIVQIFDIAQQDGCPYFTLEYVEGQPLNNYLRSKVLEPQEAAQITSKIARALHFAHKNGILHRDIKPANVLLTPDGDPKVTDFGLAKKMNDSDSSSTRTGTVMGTPSYMPPEQARGEVSELTPSVDQYSVGATLYEMLTGRPPFVGPNIMDTIFQVLRNDPVAPRQLQPKVPADLETICLKSLSKSVSSRYATCEEMADELDRYLRGEPIKARPVGKAEKLYRWCKRNPAIATLSAMAISLLLVVTFGSVWFSWTLAKSNADLIDAQGAERLAAAEAKQKAIEAEQSREQAEESRILAETSEKEATERARIAVETVQVLLKEVQDQLRNASGQQPLRRRLLELAKGQLDKLPELPKSSDVQNEVNQLAFYRLMYTLELELGNTEQAKKHIDSAITISKSRMEKQQNSDASRSNHASTLASLAKLYEVTNRDLKTAADYLQQSAQLFEEIAKDSRANSEGKGKVPITLARKYCGAAWLQLGVLSYRIGDPQRSLEGYSKSLQYLTEAKDGLETDPEMKKLKPEELVAEKKNLELAILNSRLAQASQRIRSGDLSNGLDPLKSCIADIAAIAATSTERPDIQSLYTGGLGVLFDYTMMVSPNDTELPALLEKQLALAQKSYDADPMLVEAQRLLALSHYRNGVLLDEQGEPERSQAAFQRCLELREMMLKADPSNAKRQLAMLLVAGRLYDFSKAAPLAQAIEQDSKADSELLIDAARALAQCSRTTDSKLSEEAVSQAKRLIERAISQGYADLFYLEKEPDLKPLRSWIASLR